MSNEETVKPPQVGGSALNDGLGVFLDLYDSEINFTISTFWDSGYKAKLGDEMNGFKDESDCLNNIQDVVRELTRMAIQQYPDSTFAGKYA